MKRRIGIPAKKGGVVVRGIRHLSECLVAMFPDDHSDEECTCDDYSPDWTL